MVEKVIRSWMCHAIHSCAKSNNKYMKDCDPSTESRYPMYLDVNNLYGRAVSQKLPVNGFKWKNDKFNFYESFVQTYDENSYKG